MATEQYGQSQVKEVIFSPKEIEEILLDNYIKRTTTPYDFDYQRPIILHTQKGIIFRFVQSEVTHKENLNRVEMKPLKV